MTFADTLRQALTTFDLAELEFAADGFGWSGELADLVDTVAEAKAKDFTTALAAVSEGGPFACFALACLVRHAGLGQDVVLDGPVSTLPKAIAGNLVVRGPVVCDSDSWLLVAGDVTADALITSADVIIAGQATLKQGVIGLSSWMQSMWIRQGLTTPVLITSDYATEVGDVEATELGDDADAFLVDGLVKKISGWQSKGGPDDAIKELRARVKRQQPIFAATDA